MEKITVSKKFKINIADHRVQSLYKELNGTISSDRLSEVLDEIEKLPQLNKSAVRIRNKKGVLIALVGEKGSLKKFSIDYCKTNTHLLNLFYLFNFKFCSIPLIHILTVSF